MSPSPPCRPPETMVYHGGLHLRTQRADSHSGFLFTVHRHFVSRFVVSRLVSSLPVRSYALSRSLPHPPLLPLSTAFCVAADGKPSADNLHFAVTSPPSPITKPGLSVLSLAAPPADHSHSFQLLVSPIGCRFPFSFSFSNLSPEITAKWRPPATT